MDTGKELAKPDSMPFEYCTREEEETITKHKEHVSWHLEIEVWAHEVMATQRCTFFAG